MGLRNLRRRAKFLRALVALPLAELHILHRVATAARGIADRECPICGHLGGFSAYGDPPRYDAECPECHSLERHRLLCLALRERRLDADLKILHFAAEKAVARLLPQSDYVSADLQPGRGDVVLNIEAIDRPDASYDLVVASHVLEHVDDRRALSELRRILRPGGTLIVMAPVIEGWEISYEDKKISTAADRRLHFGQADHVRFFGRDLRQRIRDAGFLLEEFSADGASSVRHGLIPGERVFFGLVGEGSGPALADLA